MFARRKVVGAGIAVIAIAVLGCERKTKPALEATADPALAELLDDEPDEPDELAAQPDARWQAPSTRAEPAVFEEEAPAVVLESGEAEGEPEPAPEEDSEDDLDPEATVDDEAAAAEADEDGTEAEEDETADVYEGEAADEYADEAAGPDANLNPDSDPDPGAAEEDAEDYDSDYE